MNDSDDQMNSEDFSNTEDELTSAFGELRSNAQSVPPGGVPSDDAVSRRSPAKWFAGGAIAVAASIAVIAGVMATRPDEKVLNVGSDSGETPASTIIHGDGPTTTAVQDPNGPMTVQYDGYFPWIYPTPFLSSFEEGCPSPEETALQLLEKMGWRGDLAVNLESETSNRVEVSVAAPTEGEGVRDTLTHLSLELIELPFELDCDPWGVVSVSSPDDVVIASPLADSQFAGNNQVTGTGRGFEANIGLRALDANLNEVGQGYATAGWEMTDFAGVLLADSVVSGTNLVVVATSSGAIGNGDPFAAVKVRFGTLDTNVSDEDPTDGMAETSRAVNPAAVVGVAEGDTLNIRTGPGVENPVLVSIWPTSIGEIGFTGSTEGVGNQAWAEVRMLRTGETGWVNSQFVIPVEGSTLSLGSYSVLSQVRESLVSGGITSYLNDMFAHNDSSMIVSTDGFLDVGRMSQPITDIDELLETYGQELAGLSDATALTDTKQITISANGPLAFVEFFSVPDPAKTSRLQLVFSQGASTGNSKYGLTAIAFGGE